MIIITKVTAKSWRYSRQKVHQEKNWFSNSRTRVNEALGQARPADDSWTGIEYKFPKLLIQVPCRDSGQDYPSRLTSAGYTINCIQSLESSHDPPWPSPEDM